MARKYRYTREQLEKKLEEYFSDEKNRPYSILEICEFLNISWETWKRWEANPKEAHSELLKKAKLRVAKEWEKGKVPIPLAIFLLKNHLGYTDRTDVGIQNVDDRAFEVTHRLAGMTEKDLRRLAEINEIAAKATGTKDTGEGKKSQEGKGK